MYESNWVYHPNRNNSQITYPGQHVTMFLTRELVEIVVQIVAANASALFGARLVLLGGWNGIITV